VSHPDNQIVLAGLANAASNNQQAALVRLAADGALDTTFNGSGSFQQMLIPHKANLFLGVALQPNDGELLALWDAAGDFRLERFTMANQSAIVSTGAQVTILDNDQSPLVANPQSIVIDEHVPYSGVLTASGPDGDTWT